MIVVGLRLSLLLLALILSIIASTLLLSLNQPGLNFLPKHARTLSPVYPLFPERTLTHREHSRQQLSGSSFDFENIATKDQSNFQRFMAKLEGMLHPKNLLVSVNVPANDPAFPYHDLARNADELILTAYDEHWSTGSPGLIASLSWFTRVLNQRRRDIPADKMSGYWQWQRYREKITWSHRC